MSKQKTSLWKQTTAWLKDIPRKLEILLNNLYTMFVSLACITLGVGVVLVVVPETAGYLAFVALVTGITVAVDGSFKLVKFLMERGENGTRI